jgi:glutathione S-transferase
MALTLHMHPLSSYCHKALIAFYENDTPFKAQIVDLGNESERAQFRKLWPIAKFPVLHDAARDRVVPESTIIVEYLAQHYPGKVQLLPTDPDLALQTRLRDRFYDLYVHHPMQTIVGDKLRPPGRNDPHGVAQAQAQLRTSYEILERQMERSTWAMGETFTLADCAAAPALFYADYAVPLGDAFKNLAAYRKRLMERPSYARILKEAEPYFGNFPLKDRALGSS